MRPFSDDSLTGQVILKFSKSLDHIDSSYSSWMSAHDQLIIESSSEYEYIKTLLYQLPLLFLLSAIWISLFAGIILTTAISYASVIFYELYNFREDGSVSYFDQSARNIASTEKNQPLLGFTIIFILIILFIIVAVW
jgi:hypothetical protein